MKTKIIMPVMRESYKQVVEDLKPQLTEDIDFEIYLNSDIKIDYKFLGPNISVWLQKENIGFNAVLNTLWDETNYDYVGIIGDDFRVGHNTLKILLNFL